MLSTKLKEAAGNSADATLYVDDVFSTWLYTGNGSTQTITNGIDLAGKGGLVWLKRRDAATNNLLFDTLRGPLNKIESDGAAGQGVFSDSLTAFNSNGFTLGPSGNINGTGVLRGCSWTFRKAAKFFDVVTYTGTGSARTIAHSLGVAPGMVIVKRTDTTGNWQVYHRSLTSAANSIQLNLTNTEASAPTVWNSTAPTSSVFSVGTDATVNASGGTYVAYLYAHDASSTGIIQCGGYTGTDYLQNITLGWEPQFILLKNLTTGNNWVMVDTMRKLGVGTCSPLYPNSSLAEQVDGFNYPTISANGFTVNGNTLNLSPNKYIYMAIRMPNKPPTSGMQVFSPVAYNSNATAQNVDAGFPVDMVGYNFRNLSSGHTFFFDRLRGVNSTNNPRLVSTSTNAEALANNVTGAYQTGLVVESGGTTGYTMVNWNFKRAPGFFDEVCYTGTGASYQTLNHNLGVSPQLLICKSRSAASTSWVVNVEGIGLIESIGILNTTAAFGGSAYNNGYISAAGAPAGQFYAGFGTTNNNNANASATTYVAYLFATLAGISKVGSYTGNGGTQNIECGFAAGARFVLIKRTDSTGDWYVWDTARGIVSANDPHLSLNTTAAEVTTDDSVDPYSAGFAVNQVAATNINVLSATYVYLSIA